ncbi:restriction endonuclease [Streptomyces sp. 4N509B]|uniref:restriction endonuclease n=1 Tax=Streptomyces sp. 4N509B TaxID=3457413 RepID=UPI003FD5310A
MSRRSRGVVGAWAQAQRQQQLRAQAAHRTWERQQREEERQRRAWERHLARTEKERQAAYRRGREEAARQRTEELEAHVARLEGLLAAGCAAPAFHPDALTRPEEIEPFQPGPLAEPVPMPDPARYQVRQDGWGPFGGARRAQAEAEARARYERDWHAAQAAEAQRQQQLAAYRQQYEQWAGARLTEIRRHNEDAAQLVARVRRGEAEAVVEFFSAALYASTVWPEDFPHRVEAAFDPDDRQLVLDWELPAYAVVPENRAVRYVASSDEERETARPATQRRALYRSTLAQCVLLVLRELFAADAAGAAGAARGADGALRSVVVNGFVDDHDPATGRRTQTVLATVTAPRTAFEELDLTRVDPVECLVGGLGGRLSTRPDQLAAVTPGRRPADVGRGVVSLGDDDPDLLEMDPVAFEDLVAELFRARGMQAVTTQRSNDGGVDVAAFDPDPIRGGRIIVQVKRYRNTVPPSAVRDLYGTVQDAGANKGILVTTSGFGPGSETFANGKPLTLINGGQLVALLHEAGLPGRVGGGAQARTPAPEPAPEPVPVPEPVTRRAAAPAPVPAQRTAPTAPAPAPEEDANVLGMAWRGAVALDVCALVCQGQRALSDQHFVFYNNPRTPDGAVRSVAATPPDRAALRVAFDGLPAHADRLVLAAAVDPTVDPDADLSGFVDARIRLADAAGAELDTLDVSDGRPGETALVLGSFRRRPNGDWAFVTGGRGYTGGLAELIADHGIDVA